MLENGDHIELESKIVHSLLGSSILGNVMKGSSKVWEKQHLNFGGHRT